MIHLDFVIGILDFIMSQLLNSYLLVSAVLFSLGIYGLLCRRNLIGIFISIELILNSTILNFLAFNRFLSPDKGLGQVFAIFIIGLAAAEVAIGLSIVLYLYRGLQSVDIEKANQLKG